MEQVSEPDIVKNTEIISLGVYNNYEKEMATHSTILAWRIPWTEEPGVAKSQTQFSEHSLTYD